MLKQKYFWAGLGVRLATAPFLLQWFHPDERQMLEFSHFHAHGRLQPFMESALHMRNQTLPWLFSHAIKALDAIGLYHPWAWLTLIHALIGIASWLGLCALVETMRDGTPGNERMAKRLGWFFALFWGFPFLYSRQLLEAVSLPSACFLFLSIKKWQPLRSGIWAGLTAILRYPSALFAPGAVLLALFERRKHRLISGLAFGAIGLIATILIGGIADYATYGKWLESAPAYWNFNAPNGPVAQMFGQDSLVVYLRWFEFLFTPVFGPIVLIAGIIALLRQWDLLLFLLPYTAGHLWTPHREPRFMLPLLPFMALALAREWAKHPTLEQYITKFKLACWALIAVNFVWYPLYIWAQLT
jgi:uncharacterized membrane protein YpjA